MSQWTSDMHARIAGAIKRARGKRSAQWLADRTTELGYPITRAQIANYESGRKQSLDIAELIVLAAALDTSPVVLVYPGPYDDETIEGLPRTEASKFVAAEWFSANRWFGVAEEPGDDPMARWRAAVNELNLNRQLADLQQQRTRAQFEAMNTDLTQENLSLHNSRLKLLDDSIADLRMRLGIEDNA